MNQNGTYNIVYEDGDKERGVARINIREAEYTPASSDSEDGNGFNQSADKSLARSKPANRPKRRQKRKIFERVEAKAVRARKAINKKGIDSAAKTSSFFDAFKFGAKVCTNCSCGLAALLTTFVM